MTRQPVQGDRCPRPLPAPAQRLLARLDGLPGRLELCLPDGRRLLAGRGDGEAALLLLHTWDACAQLLHGGERGLADAYVDGVVQAPALARVLACLRAGAACLPVPSTWWPPRWPGRRANVHTRHRLGSAFYALWLDPSLTYSCARFGTAAGLTLEAAQRAKHAQVLDRLDLRGGERILDLGCGWGGFALQAAATRDCVVDGVTLSAEQARWGSERAARLGLAGRVALRRADFRDSCGRYDRAVSIEVYETLGPRQWDAYFRTLAARLRPGGTAVLQAITRPARRGAPARAQADFVRRQIAPRAALATPAQLLERVRAAGFGVRGWQASTADYATTLAHWGARFEAAGPGLEALGLPLPLRRLWRFYLAHCEAGFHAGTTELVQLVLERGPES